MCTIMMVHFKKDDWYGPLPLDLDDLKPEKEEPLMFQIADQVYNAVEKGRLDECDMSDTTLQYYQICLVMYRQFQWKN